jgi:hypothetical protein
MLIKELEEEIVLHSLVLNPNVVATMRVWGMNVVRISISNWQYQLPNYLTPLDLAKAP